MAHTVRLRFGHPVQTAREKLAGWKSVLDQIEERLLRSSKLGQLIARFRDDVRAEANGARLAPTGGHFMELYLVRHGIAVESGGGIADTSRPLTEKGRRRFQKTARAFGKLGHRLDLILTSPLVRAVQTAEILAGATDHGEVAVLEELDQKFDAEAVRAAIAARVGKAGAVAVVGHEPQLSMLLSALSGVPQADLDLKKGAVVRLDASTLTDGASASPRWWLKPKGTRVKGLPLQKQARKAHSAASAKPARPARAARKRRHGKRLPPRPLKPAVAVAGAEEGATP
jgi:phosphohistidine phosphatase